jgi:hypothetical protein
LKDDPFSAMIFVVALRDRNTISTDSAVKEEPICVAAPQLMVSLVPSKTNSPPFSVLNVAPFTNDPLFPVYDMSLAVSPLRG